MIYALATSSHDPQPFAPRGAVKGAGSLRLAGKKNIRRFRSASAKSADQFPVRG